MNKLKCAVIGTALFLSACSESSSGETYTLYRGSIVGNMRVHMATFDAAEGNGYNQTNCQIAADLFARQPGVSVRYWCEKGKYRD